MRRIAGLVFVLAVSATAATAADDVMAPRFGNTIVITDANGGKSTINYNADHTFKASNGLIGIGGTWKLEGGRLCRTYDFTIPGRPNPECDSVTPHKVGDTWTSGESTYSLVKGMQ
jgi:hypothetical protein